MEIHTAWVKPPRQIGGLDHLAVQAPCINIYGRMLPGITNVTDRARYYSFYPWIVWALEKEGYRYDDAFVEQYRRADILFTLIANRHAHISEGESDDHSSATIGSANLAYQIADIREDKPVRLSDYSHRRDEKSRYFKNKLGGLGQYYLGVLRELSIMDGTAGAGIKNTKQFGVVIAEAMNQAVNRQLFIKTLSEDLVPVKRLDELKSFCPCHLINNADELKVLIDLFFVKEHFADTDMLPRRRTLQAFLYLADGLADIGLSIKLLNFKGCSYSGALPNGSTWALPERLNQNRLRWAVYQQNELLSLAVQGVFYALLDTYEHYGQRLNSGEELCQWFIEGKEVELLADNISLETTVDVFFKSADDWLPEITDWTSSVHEIQLGEQIVELCGAEKTTENRKKILEASLKILIALIKRSDSANGYNNFVFHGHYFEHYPINLTTLQSNFEKKWTNLSIKEWIYWLCHEWGVQAHFMVALRKLRGNSQSTFRIRPSDDGLELITVPQAAHTSPRFYQAVRILKDIGALEKQDERWVVSSLGHDLKEENDG